MGVLGKPVGFLVGSIFDEVIVRTFFVDITRCAMETVEMNAEMVMQIISFFISMLIDEFLQIYDLLQKTP